jgi:hypothetical protein
MSFRSEAALQAFKVVKYVDLFSLGEIVVS